jgi:Ca2+-transporting ATPase
MADKALRVLAAGYKPYVRGEAMEKDLVFSGMAGMIDPPRAEVYEAVAKCRAAGITPIMITGDHKDTAMAIAKEIGLLEEGTEAIFGRELDDMTEEQLDARLANIRVYARVSPEHKVRIVKAWKKRGKVVAMTGDGVNDAPALKTADIGIGMGITGTDVSKGVADMLLSDDNFATIVAAVEEGRKIYLNIRKAVQFLLSSNISEVLALLVATFALPAGVVMLGPVHILWINLVTDTLPAIALGVDPAPPDLMREKPRDSNKSFFADGLVGRLIYQGLILAGLTLLSYWVGATASPIVGTTMAFVTLSSVQLFHVFNIKAGDRSVLHRRTLNNRFLLLAAALPLALIALIVCVPPIAAVFSVTQLTLAQWGAALGLAFAVIPLVELVKLVQRLGKR